MKELKEEKRYGLAKVNYLLILVSFVVIIIGFLLMSGEPSGAEFNPDIYSTRRIVVAPIISLLGFVAMIAAIMYKPTKANK